MCAATAATAALYRGRGIIVVVLSQDDKDPFARVVRTDVYTTLTGIFTCWLLFAVTRPTPPSPPKTTALYLCRRHILYMFGICSRKILWIWIWHCVASGSYLYCHVEKIMYLFLFVSRCLMVFFCSLSLVACFILIFFRLLLAGKLMTLVGGDLREVFSESSIFGFGKFHHHSFHE